MRPRVPQIPDVLRARVHDLARKITEQDRELVQGVMINATAQLLDFMQVSRTYRAVLFDIVDAAYKHGMPLGTARTPQRFRAIIKKAEVAQRKREREARRQLKKSVPPLVWSPTTIAETTLAL
jgi:hypothetical protein